MALPTFTVAPLRASQLQALVDRIRQVRKASDETVNNSTTLQDDDRLALAVAANTTYDLFLRLTVNSGTTADFKVDWTFPAGLTGSVDYFEGESPGTAATVLRGPIDIADPFAFSGVAADQPIHAVGTVTTGSTAGTLQLQWAQNTADVSNTTVKTGSYLRLIEIA